MMVAASAGAAAMVGAVCAPVETAVVLASDAVLELAIAGCWNQSPLVLEPPRGGAATMWDQAALGVVTVEGEAATRGRDAGTGYLGCWNW